MAVEANIKQLYRGYQRGAKKRKLRWSLSLEEFTALIAMDCYLCGCEPNNVYIHDYKQQHYVKEPLIYTGLDRIENESGYTLDNVSPTCKKCNYWKRGDSLADFMEHVERVYEFAIKPHKR